MSKHQKHQKHQVNEVITKDTEEEITLTPSVKHDKVITKSQQFSGSSETIPPKGTSEERFTAGLMKIITDKVKAGQGRFLSLDEILPTFRSSI